MLNAKQKKHLPDLLQKKALLEDLSQKKALLEGLGHRKALLEGLGHRKALLEGLGHRKALLEGLGHRKALHLGHRKALLEGLGHRKALLEGLGHRKALLEGVIGKLEGLSESFTRRLGDRGPWSRNSYSVGSYPRDFYSIPPPDISPSPLRRTASPALSYSPTALRDLRLDSPPHRTSSLSVEPSREKEPVVTKVKPKGRTYSVKNTDVAVVLISVISTYLIESALDTYFQDKSILYVILFLSLVTYIVEVYFPLKKIPVNSNNS